VLQAFLAVCNSMALVARRPTSPSAGTRKKALVHTREELESRVMDRTATLLQVNADLLSEVREREKAEKTCAGSPRSSPTPMPRSSAWTSTA